MIEISSKQEIGPGRTQSLRVDVRVAGTTKGVDFDLDELACLSDDEALRAIGHGLAVLAGACQHHVSVAEFQRGKGDAA